MNDFHEKENEIKLSCRSSTLRPTNLQAFISEINALRSSILIYVDSVNLMSQKKDDTIEFWWFFNAPYT